MESKRLRSPTPPPAASHGESKVLGDDNLLREIIVRLAFPTDLVRTALVCKRWLSHASEPAFLRRFRKLHPLRPLGFYIDTRSADTASPRFVEMPAQPPELAAVCRRASFDLDSFIWDCWNGSVLIISQQGDNGLTSLVYSPLCPSRSMPVVPELPQLDHISPANYTFEKLLFREGDDNGMPYLWLLLQSINHVYTVHVYMLQDGVWSKHTSATTEFPHLPSEPKPLLINSKIYMTAALSLPNVVIVDNTSFRAAVLSGILVMDLKDSSLFTIQLPEGVEFLDIDVLLAKADDDSGVYLIQLKDLKLRIWLHSSSTGNWLLVDTICLREMLAALTASDHTVGGEHTVLRMKEAGDNAEFVFFQMGPSILYLDIKCRELRKVYAMTEHHQFLGHIYPFMMVWPPTFPAPKDDLARNAS
uniref:Uncharacterized protein n=2 Tax=Avena sativa TaxID=4498 RepID=A0ACD5TL77_AVESA